MTYSLTAGTLAGERQAMTHKHWSVSILAALSMLGTVFAIPAMVSGEATVAEWTVMVYLDGDNNLDPYAVSDLAEMQTVGSTDKVNVIVLEDRYSEPAYLYQVTLGDMNVLDGLSVNGVPVNGEEISMADVRVLDAFVDYCKAEFPANHYMLDLWDHGNAFGYTCWDDHSDPEWQTPADALSLSDVIGALSGSGGVDILTYDGCTIGMVEIAYQLAFVQKNMGVNVNYLVASEEYIPGTGYAYNNILAEMNSMSDLSPAAVAKMMADVYAACYSPHGQAKGSSTVGLSVIDLPKILPIAPVIHSLVDILKQGLALDYSHAHDMIAKARGAGNLGWSLNGWDDRIDFGMFLKTLAQISPDPAVQSLCTQAFGIITDAVYAANTPALSSAGAYGLGTWFPSSSRSLGNANTGGGFDVIAEYSDAFAYADDSGWLSFLSAFWGKAPKK